MLVNLMMTLVDDEVLCVFRQEKLEQLALRFDRKAGMRETWLSENQRLVSQDNFGYDLAAVEASTKKHEAIEADISSYEERVQAVVSVAFELEQENYRDIERINSRKDNVLRLWQYLLELLKARCIRLEVSLHLQKVFQEMLYILDWMDEIKVRLQSEDYGKHLMGVEDLLQKHSLLESDIKVVGERVKTINGQAEKFVVADFPEAGDYKPCDPQVVKDRMTNLDAAYEELLQLAAERRKNLGESRKLWQFYWEMADEEQWMKEKEQLMSSPDLGHDLTTVHLLLSKHKSNEDEMAARHQHMLAVNEVGKELIASGNFGSDKIQQRIDEVKQQWTNLVELADYRKKRLNEAVDYHQFFTDADDVDTWMYDTWRMVSSEDVGHDETSVQALLKKHKDVTDGLHNYHTVITALHEQAENLGESDRENPEVLSRLGTIDRRYQELLELAKMRKQRLLDALALYKLFNEADSVDQWIDEKEKLLKTMVPSDDVEEVEILKARFSTFDQEMNANESKVGVVNELARQLLNNTHPNSDEVVAREKKLNQRWMELRELVDEKRRALNLSYNVNTWHSETRETMTWIREKAKLIESTDELDNDLAGVITLQRRLSGLQRDLAAIQAKLDSLNQEAEQLSEEKPEEAEAIRTKTTQITELWMELKQMLKVRDERLGEASDLQKFLQNLDHFQQWLTRTQTTIASEDIPSDLAEAERMLNQHEQIKSEIDGYADEYASMKSYGEQVVEGQDDVQYMFLRERLKALDDGWEDVQKMWENKQQQLSQSLNLQMFMRDVKQAEVLLSQQDNVLSKEEVPTTLESAENLIKKHEAFITTIDTNDEKINAVLQFGNRLVDENHYASERIKFKIDSIEERRSSNRRRAYEQLERLKDAMQVQKFLQNCDELNDWLSEKMIAAQDETYRDAKNIHSKYRRYQAFESEIASNKDRLNKLQQEGEELMREKPDTTPIVEPKLAELNQQWQELEDTTQQKGQKLFDANRHILYEQSCDDIDGWISEIESQIVTEDVGHDLTTVNLLVQKQNILESQMKIKQQQVGELESQASHLKQLDPDQEQTIVAKKQHVEERFAKVLEPLNIRRSQLEKAKMVHQFLRDLEDEKLWVAEKMPQATSTDYGNSLLSVQMLQKKNQSLHNEINNHRPYLDNVLETGEGLIDSQHPLADDFQRNMDELKQMWEELDKAVEYRREQLVLSEIAQQYFFDAAEAEAWMSEQELYMMSEDRAKDEMGATNMLKKHGGLEKTVDDYAETIRQLGERSRNLVDEGHPNSDAILVKQSQVDKLYASLKDMMGERRGKLDEVLKLYMLNREIEDIEQWIAEREVVAGSHELGQDYEHVTMLRDRFKEFARDTENIGQERVAAVNEICDQLIAAEHTDAATIAEWKDMINEMWADLLELIDTRTQMLAASWELHKFFNDCKETLDRIHEKEFSIPDELGKDAQSVAALQRRHANFEHDLLTLGAQVQQVQEESAKLIVAYSGDKAIEIQDREAEVVNAWRNLQIHVDTRKNSLSDAGDLYRFFNMVRDLLLWMKDMDVQMSTQEKPRDVSGVELLMNYHQSVKAEIDSRDEKFSITVNLGRDLLARKHYRSQEVRERLIQLGTQRGNMMELWEQRWEHLQLILEVYQFARDAAVAEAWLAAHEPYLQNQEYGETLDAVEALIKKHDVFEKSAATQEERFAALERLTTFELLFRGDTVTSELSVQQQLSFLEMKFRQLYMAYENYESLMTEPPALFELRERQKRQEAEFRAQHPDMSSQETSTLAQKYIDEFLPPPEPEPEPEPEPVQPEPVPIIEEPAASGEPAAEAEKRQAEALAQEPEARASQPEAAGTVQMRQPESGSKPPAKKKRRSKSPFKRREKSEPEPLDTSAHGEGAEGSDHFQGVLNRKHEWESTTKKASNRSWEKLYCVLLDQQRSLVFYKDQKHARADPSGQQHHRPALELPGASATVATDYVKRPHVYRLKLASGGDYLFQCKDDEEMNSWISKLNGAVGAEASPSRAQTLPASSDGKKDEPKRRSFFTLGKKK
ncbi:hypothetical protein NP493_368g02093 [Ridgeia piscesae]|uniref:Spectrin beta chain n=2 Tax=Ridgeia piscesae TaxID=27915 RepID=A0AAD9NV99_RIDPI|nr:hypothetical protein NP493_368g02093 [Ridgeia piscesae]